MARQDNQIKSKKRVVDHGEVFTSEREVNAMLDMVGQEAERIDSRFLEPACGDGNFLAVILQRKLEIVSKKYKKSQIEYERYSILAVSSVYGIDIMEDNVRDCRKRLLDIFNESYMSLYKKKIKKDIVKAAEFILSKNIVCGNALDMKKTDGNPIVLAEWSLLMGSKMKRRDYEYVTLLSDKDEDNLASEINEDAFIPRPLTTYPAKHIARLFEDE